MKKTNPVNIPQFKFDNQLNQYLFADWKPESKELYHKFQISKVENYKDFIRIPTPPHRRTLYFLFFLTKGYAIRSCNLTEYEVTKNHFFIVPANQISSLKYLSDDIQGFTIHFSPEIFNHNQLNVNVELEFPFFEISNNRIIKANSPIEVKRSLKALWREYAKNDQKREKIIALHLLSLLNEINFDFDNKKLKPSTAAFRITQQYKNMLSEQFGNFTKVANYAAELSVSPNHLNKCAKEATGKSAHELLVDMRILQAKVLLKQSNLPVKEIAYKIGGFESSDFAKFFKKKTLQSPSEYRSQFTN